MKKTDQDDESKIQKAEQPKKTKKAYNPVEEAELESFPTSDPPSWTLGSRQEANAFKKANKEGIVHLLYEEHQVIRKVAATIPKMIILLENNRTLSPQLVSNLNEFLHFFVEQCHYQKEELLFPALKYGAERPSDYLLHDLVTEHERGRELIADIKEKLLHYNSQDSSMQQTLIQDLKELKNLFQNHLAKEEEYVLPLVKNLLSKHQEKTLLDQFQEIEKKLGQKTHQHLIDLADQITNES